MVRRRRKIDPVVEHRRKLVLQTLLLLALGGAVLVLVYLTLRGS